MDLGGLEARKVKSLARTFRVITSNHFPPDNNSTHLVCLVHLERQLTVLDIPLVDGISRSGCSIKKGLSAVVDESKIFQQALAKWTSGIVYLH